MKTLKKVLLTSAAGLALSFGSVSAYAFSFNIGGYSGDIQIKYNMYTAECNSHTSTCYGGNVANAGASAETIAGPGAGTFNETTFGIGRVTTVQDSAGNVDFWTPGSTGTQLMVFLYGVADLQADLTGAQNILNVGCKGGVCDEKIHMDFYEVSQATYAANGFLDGLATSRRTAFDTFTGITDGNLVLKTTFAPGIITSGPGTAAELIQTVAGNTLPTTGLGSWLANCAPGNATTNPACNGVNGLNLDNNAGTNGTDFFGQFTLTTVQSQTALDNGWLGQVNDPILTRNVPEPNIMFLFGVGLFGMGTVRSLSKRRNNA